jgi:aldehyde dehydrogenase (NAD+)
MIETSKNDMIYVRKVGYVMQISQIVEKQRKYFLTGKTKSYQSRVEALSNLRKGLHQYENELFEALYNDLNKSRFESHMTEIGVTLLEIKEALKHLKKWMKTKKVKTPLPLFKASSYIYQEPYGTTLIISPWNYPVQLALAPLVGALSAGNTAVLKLSPDAPNTGKVLKKMINEFFIKEHVDVVLGGLEESKAVLKERFDYIFFTGSTAVGKIVMEQASKHLTPVTLELGGKSPCIVDSTANIHLAARRIAFGKIMNAGQTCIAPDYIYVHESVKNKLIDETAKQVKLFLGEQPLEAKDYPKIVNDKHYQRLLNLMKDEKIVYGGKHENQKIEPTILDQITRESKVMQEEIFGPILPILTYTNDDELIQDLKAQEKPLAVYIFSNSRTFQNRIIHELSFGGATINDTIMHVASGYLPFGGVGYSGMGSYHGKQSFLTFSHAKPVLKRSTKIDLRMRYHPYTKTNEKMLKMFLK